MIAQVIYDYEAQTTDELTIKEGQILLITDDNDQDWWEAQEKTNDTFQEGAKGLVPLTYVEELAPLCFGTALYDYDANTEEEISIREGDLVRIYEKMDADWWYVKVDDNVGLAPATYIQMANDQNAYTPQGQPQEYVKPLVTESEQTSLGIINAEVQKNKLLSALDGFGFEKKVTAKPTGMIYGPDDVTYYSVVDVDKKNKKNNKKALFGVCHKEWIAYCLDPVTKEITYKFEIKSIKKFKCKKTKIVIELENDVKEYEGEKSDIQALNVYLETALNSKPPPESPKVSKAVPVSIIQTAAVENSSSLPLAVALFDYDAATDEELTIREKDKLDVIDCSDVDWWLVRHTGKKGEGLVPKSYIELVQGSAATSVFDIPKSPEKNTAEIERQFREMEMKRLREEQEAERIKKQMQERERQKEEERRLMEQKRRDEEKLEADRREYERKEAEKRELEKREIEREAERKDSQRSKIPLMTNVPVVSKGPALPSKAGAPTLPERPAEPVIPNRVNVDLKPVAPLSRPEKKSMPTAKPSEKSTMLLIAGPDASNLRKWSDKTGNFSVDAAYLSFKEGKVILQKENGSTVKVPLEKLDDASIQYVQAQPGNGEIVVESKQNAPVPRPGLKNVNIGEILPATKQNAELYTYNGFNWKEWLMKAGVSNADSAAYASKFVEQKVDASILTDIDRDALRAMKITEGDIIRIRKAANLPSVTTAFRSKNESNERVAQARNLELLAMKGMEKSQVESDEALARRLQEEENRKAQTSNFSSNQVDSNVIFEAGNLLKKSNMQKRPLTVSASNSMKPKPHSPVRNSMIHPSPTRNDPWTSFDNLESKWREQQSETEKQLQMANISIQKANEQAKQAALIEEQARAKKSEQALLQAQETARRAMEMQKLAEEKLQKAKEEADRQAKMQAQYQAQLQNRPLATPLIPLPNNSNMINANFNNFNSNNQTMSSISDPTLLKTNPNNFNYPQQMARPIMNQTLQSSQNWSSVDKNNDKYSAFRESTPDAPSLFNSASMMTNNLTGNSQYGSISQGFPIQSGLSVEKMGMHNTGPPSNRGSVVAPANVGFSNQSSIGMKFQVGNPGNPSVFGQPGNNSFVGGGLPVNSANISTISPQFGAGSNQFAQQGGVSFNNSQIVGQNPGSNQNIGIGLQHSTSNFGSNQGIITNMGTIPPVMNSQFGNQTRFSANIGMNQGIMNQTRMNMNAVPNQGIGANMGMNAGINNPMIMHQSGNMGMNNINTGMNDMNINTTGMNMNTMGMNTNTTAMNNMNSTGMNTMNITGMNNMNQMNMNQTGVGMNQQNPNQFRPNNQGFYR